MIAGGYMQVTVTTPAPAPAPQVEIPAPPTPVSIVYKAPDGTEQTIAVPLTRGDVRNLLARRDELSKQLSSVTGRRHSLSEEIKSAPAGASRTGLESRLGVLDTRINQLESDIAAVGKALSAAPSGLVAGTQPAQPGDDMPDNVAAISAVTIIFVFFPIALAMSRWIWRRSSKGPAVSTAQLSPQVDQRLERLEQGVEAIAIEIERVTEGQRFVTKLLSEQATNASREKLTAG
jgi:hypothetical protein